MATFNLALEAQGPTAVYRYIEIWGTADPVAGSPNDYQIVSIDPSFHNVASDGYQFLHVGGPDSGTDNYLLNAFGLDGVIRAAVPGLVDSSGISIHTGGTADHPEVVSYIFRADTVSPTGYILSDSLGNDTVVGVVRYYAFCFTTGTRIRLDNGEKPVERLAVGDKVLTTSGSARPIRWIGQRTMLSRGPDQCGVWPIRVLKDAFGPAQPYRDLWLSPGHSICVDVVGEVLIPIGKLINGATIAQVEVDQITYWHVELDSHDIMLADGLPAESYLDTCGRRWFEGGQGTPDPTFAGERCRPLHESGPLVEVVRERLAERARTDGWRDGGDPEIHLIVDGQRINPKVTEGVACFRLPAASQEAWLHSEPFVPALWNVRDDYRQLGLLVSELEVTTSNGTETIAASDLRFTEGFHAPERHDGRDYRWTNGRAYLPITSEATANGEMLLTVRFHPTGTRCWLAPSGDPRIRNQHPAHNGSDSVRLWAA